MVKRGISGALMIIIIIMVILLIWGLVGANEAKDVGVTCDMGIGDLLCWKWHKNILGQVGEAIGDIPKRLP